MIDEKEPIETGEAVDTDSDYINTIKKLKQSTVSRSEFDKLKADRDRLLNDIVNGQTIEPAQEVIPTDKEIEELRKQLFHSPNGLNNLEYAKKSLELRDAVIKAGGADPFLPHSKDRNPTPENLETADRVAKILQQCIEESDGSSEMFTAELMRRTK